jgi:uncharacterized protein YjcR
MAKGQDEAVLREQAKVLYMRGTPNKHICDELDIEQVKLSQWVSTQKWLHIREEVRKEIVEAWVKGKKEKMTNISLLSLDIIESALKHRKEEAKDNKDKPLTLAEAKLVADIFSQVDKVYKLDSGEATERTQVNAVTLDDLREALHLDGYIDVTPKQGDSDDDDRSTNKENE